jgi:hypothetical protein
MNFNTLHEAASIISDQVGSKLNKINQTELLNEFTHHGIKPKVANAFIDILAEMSNNQKSKRSLEQTKRLLITVHNIIKENV